MDNNFDFNRDPESFDSPTSQYIWARAREKHFKAIIAEAESRKATGELVEIEEVRAQADVAARSVRDAVTALPDRVTPMLVGRTEREIVVELRRECRELLNAVADVFEPPETDKS